MRTRTYTKEERVSKSKFKRYRAVKRNRHGMKAEFKSGLSMFKSKKVNLSID